MTQRTTIARTVLCATDLSQSGDEALRQAHHAARTRKARLVVLHVLPDPMKGHPALPLGRKPRYASLPGAQRGAADRVRAQLERTIGAEATGVDLRIEHGIPHAVVIECAEALRAELVVVGASPSHVGHEAERIVRYSHGPVLVARPSPDDGVVLAATDLSDAAFPAVAAGVAQARQRRSRLTLLYVVDMRSLMVQPDLGTGAVPLTAELQDSLLKAGRRRLARALGRFRAAGDLVVQSGEPTAVILEQAARLPSSLLVLGTAGATGLKRMLLGSVAESVVHRAPCSTLVVRLHASGTRR